MNKLILKQTLHYENHLEENKPKWFAIYTPFKREKIAAKELKKLGIQTYLPIHTVTRRYVRKTKKVDLPLINQYLFVKITSKQYQQVYQCPYVLNFVKFSKNLVSIPEREIDLIKRILGEAQSVELEDLTLRKGDQIEVIGGNLTGLTGTLIEKENSQYVNVRLTNIGISLNVSIATHLLRLVKKSVLV